MRNPGAGKWTVPWASGTLRADCTKGGSVASGAFVPTANTSLTFSVSGPGQLVGVDNGDPTDTTSYKGTSRKAFSGKALAIVRSIGTAGAIVVSASASGVTAGSVTVTATQ